MTVVILFYDSHYHVLWQPFACLVTAISLMTVMTLSYDCHHHVLQNVFMPCQLSAIILLWLLSYCLMAAMALSYGSNYLVLWQSFAVGGAISFNKQTWQPLSSLIAAIIIIMSISYDCRDICFRTATILSYGCHYFCLTTVMTLSYGWHYFCLMTTAACSYDRRRPDL